MSMPLGNVSPYHARIYNATKDRELIKWLQDPQNLSSVDTNGDQRISLPELSLFQASVKDVRGWDDHRLALGRLEQNFAPLTDAVYTNYVQDLSKDDLSEIFARLTQDPLLTLEGLAVNIQASRNQSASTAAPAPDSAASTAVTTASQPSNTPTLHSQLYSGDPATREKQYEQDRELMLSLKEEHQRGKLEGITPKQLRLRKKSGWFGVK